MESIRAEARDLMLHLTRAAKRKPRIPFAGRARLSRSLAGILVAAVLLVPAIALASQGSTATVQFGNPNAPSTGQNCFQGSAALTPEPCANAFHKLIPGAVTISSGGTVDFVRNGFHQVTIYAPGKQPNDVVIMNEAGGRVDDPNGRIFLSAPGVGGTITPPPGTFAQPGRYLVICNIATHFKQNMWGWVNVQ